jgi:hypothetical protein
MKLSILVILKFAIVFFPFFSKVAAPMAKSFYANDERTTIRLRITRSTARIKME